MTVGPILNFTRLCSVNRNGYGDQGNETTELWLGNDHVYQIARTQNTMLYISITGYDGTVSESMVKRFRLDNEDMHYTMRLDTLTPVGCTNAGLTSIGVNPFRTSYRQGSDMHNYCFQLQSAGWWYHNDSSSTCYDMFLDGLHRTNGMQHDSVVFMKDFPFYPANFGKYSLKFSHQFHQSLLFIFQRHVGKRLFV